MPTVRTRRSAVHRRTNGQIPRLLDDKEDHHGSTIRPCKYGSGCRPAAFMERQLGQRSIVEFVTTITKPDSPEFVPITERITVFDNDGTLWPEQPIFFQALFAFDRMRQLAPQHPEWKTR